jgi:hypothetical protein
MAHHLEHLEGTLDLEQDASQSDDLSDLLS